MTKITLNNVGSLVDYTTAGTTINNNFDTIETAFDNTLSRDGTSPNTMTAPIDMNSNQIYNLPSPATGNSPLRFQDLSDFIGGGTITNIPTGGTTGQVLGKSSGTSFDVAWINSVTSVGLSLPADFSVTGSPITTTGTLAATFVNTPTGTGGFVRATSPTISSPTIATGSFTGTQTFSGQIATTSLVTIATTNANALFVSNSGGVNPVLQVDTSTASQAAGVKITGAASGGTSVISAIDSGATSNLQISAKGAAGNITIGGVGNGGITVTGAGGGGTNFNIGSSGTSGAVITVAGGTSGSQIWQTNAAASGTATMFAGTDTVVGKATTDTFTNKTFNTAGTGNVFQINGTGITAVTGTGSVVLATSPTLVTPVLGVATATSINGNTFTTGTYTLTGTAGKTFTFSNTLTLSGTDSSTLAVGVGGTLTGSSSSAIFYDNMPQNSKSTAYTTVLSDAQKHILHPSADTTARTFTIDSNANVAYPIGTAITFINQNAGGVVTIAITSDTMRLAGAGTTGSRTLAANGVATAIKITSTEWIISGTGLT